LSFFGNLGDFQGFTVLSQARAFLLARRLAVKAMGKEVEPAFKIQRKAALTEQK
jgi:hypothetical protein